jgi:membrane-bound lytic murein transglycosylase D
MARRCVHLGWRQPSHSYAGDVSIAVSRPTFTAGSKHAGRGAGGVAPARSAAFLPRNAVRRSIDYRDRRSHPQILTFRCATATNPQVRVRKIGGFAAILLAIALGAEDASAQAAASSSGSSTSASPSPNPAPDKGQKTKPLGSGGASSKATSDGAAKAADPAVGANMGSRLAGDSRSSAKPSRAGQSAAPAPAKSSKATRNGNTQAGSRSPNAQRTAEPRKTAKGTQVEDNTTTTQSDPELAALERAEKALFPWALHGIRSGFSFDETPFGDGLMTDAATVAPASWVKDLSLPTIFPHVDGRILTYLEFYRSTPEGKAILRTWAKKRGRYTAAISATLAKSGVPTELVWQSLVESGHNPCIKSPAGAAGLWQFMPETARLYGLVVDRWIDERIDPERSTVAAAKMMGDLFQRFGNWELALAAYNMGEAGLLRSIRKYNTNDFWVLSHYEAGLPMETALYVPRIIALTIVMQNLAAFGVEDIAPDDPVDFDAVTLSSGQLLTVVARVIGVKEDDLYRYNPQLLAQRIPPSVSADKAVGRVFVPKGMADVVRARMGRLMGLEPDLVPYTVKTGETLEWLANARGVSVDALRAINRASNDERIEAGTILLLPRQSAEPTESKSADEDRVAVVPPDSDTIKDGRRIFYRVRSGDTLSSIADAFGVRRVDLLTYNSIDTSARLQPRMLLQLRVPASAHFENRPYFEEKDVVLLVAGSPEFSEYFEGLRGNERIIVQAKEKDTLASIGAKYGVSVGMMERINRRSRRDVLGSGENVIVYARRKASRERITAAR